jgi:uncharacterized protein (DUF433 family)
MLFLIVGSQSEWRYDIMPKLYCQRLRSGNTAATIKRKVSHFHRSTSDVLHGKPRITGTRIPVSLVLGYLAAGYTVQQIIEELPGIRPDHVAACLDYARDLAEFEVAA